MNFQKLVGIGFPLAIAGMIAAAYFSPLSEWLTLAGVAEAREVLAGFIAVRPVLAIGLFFLLCVLASAFCFPAAPIVGVAAGALFGFWTGLVTLSLAFSIGSTIACLGSRYWLRDWVKARLGRRLEAIDRGLDRHGAAYLLALRINPIIPYWLVNLAMGVTKVRLRTYVPLTVLGLLPALIIYANAGSHLAAARSSGDIVSPGIIFSLLLLSLLPLIADRLIIRPRAIEDIEPPQAAA